MLGLKVCTSRHSFLKHISLVDPSFHQLQSLGCHLMACETYTCHSSLHSNHLQTFLPAHVKSVLICGVCSVSMKASRNCHLTGIWNLGCSKWVPEPVCQSVCPSIHLSVCLFFNRIDSDSLSYHRLVRTTQDHREKASGPGT